jgi:hypothetical protein
LYDATFEGNNNEIIKTFKTVAECAAWCVGASGGWPTLDPDTGRTAAVDSRCSSFNWKQRAADSFWCTRSIAGTRESTSTVTADELSNFRVATVQLETITHNASPLELIQDYYELVTYKKPTPTTHNKCVAKPDAGMTYSSDYYAVAACEGAGTFNRVHRTHKCDVTSCKPYETFYTFVKTGTCDSTTLTA